MSKPDEIVPIVITELAPGPGHRDLDRPGEACSATTAGTTWFSRTGV